jgi:hypothetical protein
MRLRGTSFINEKAVQNLLNAFQFAKSQGFPLNLAVTVQWALAPSPDRPLLRQAKLLERAAKWGHRRKIPLVYLWVMERVAGAQPHSHIMLHMPTEYRAEFRHMLRYAWIVPSPPARLVRCQALPNPQGKLQYLLKGSETAVAEALGFAPKPQGFICGKRCGTSESVGKKARRNGGFIDQEW